MTVLREEITPAQFAEYKAMSAGELNSTVERGLPESITLGYGYYGASLEAKDGKFYLLTNIGSSCD